jgi:hypothetical protein
LSELIRVRMFDRYRPGRFHTTREDQLMRLRSRLSLSSAVICLLAVLSFGQQSNSEYPYWYDIPSAPLKFDIPARDLRFAEGQMLHIRSAGGVVRAYSLGCVRIDKESAIATETTRTWQLNQRPEDQFFPINILRVTAIPCEKRSERLAVVRVEYSDGGVWQSSASSEQNAPRVK